jgi:hypothetical protein
MHTGLSDSHQGISASDCEFGFDVLREVNFEFIAASLPPRKINRTCPGGHNE